MFKHKNKPPSKAKLWKPHFIKRTLKDCQDFTPQKQPEWKSSGSLCSARMEWQEGFSSVGCKKLCGRDENFSMSNPGPEGERWGGHAIIVGEILTFPRWGVWYSMFQWLDVEDSVVKHRRDYFYLNQFISVFYRGTFLFSFNSRHNSISLLFHLSRLLNKSGEGSQP